MLKLPTALRYPVRALLREPVFILTVLLVLALGIGGTTAVFTVVDEILFSALPYDDPDHLAMIWEANSSQPEPAGSHIPAARENFDAWRKQSRSFKAIEGYRQTSLNLTGTGRPEHLAAARSTPGLLSIFGVRPMRGRLFLSQDAMPGNNRVVLLSYSFFKSHFETIQPLGQKLLLDGIPYVVIGVLPQNFHLPNILQGLFEFKPDLWIPLPPSSASDPPMTPRWRNLLTYARLNPGVSISQARLEMKGIAARLAQENPNLNSGYSANVFSLHYEDTDPDLRRALYVLWTTVTFVLLLGCGNLTGLMVLRNARRKKDIAIITALGASRSHLVKTIIFEGLLLTFVGSLLGIAASFGGLRLIVALKPGQIHSLERIALNGHSFLFTTLLFAGVTLLICLLPAWLGTRGDLVPALKQDGGSGIGGRHRFPVRSIFVSVQVAIALTLAISSLLLLRSFHSLLKVNTGFGAEHSLTAHLTLPNARYGAVNDRAQFCARLLENLRSLPEVESASLIDNMPLYAIRYAPFEVEGRPVTKPGDAPIADYANVRPGFFETMRIPIRAGRTFADQDTETDAGKVVIINETLARKMWPSQNPVGIHIRSLDGGTGRWATIVGVVRDFVQFNVDTPARPELFWPAKQLSSMTVVVRTGGNPSGIVPLLEKTIWNIDKDEPIADVQTLEEILANSRTQTRFNTVSISVFAALGILLAVVGVYGLIAYLVSSQTRDLGIRLALGAQRSHIFLSLLRQTLPFVFAGLLLGLTLSFIASRVMDTLVFGISATDPLTYVAASLMILALMFLTFLIPARKATHLPPTLAMRLE
jgi:putative ABC transport system permease protein